jgi:hypothetical protein
MPVSSTSRYAGLSPYNAPGVDGKSYSTIPLRPQFTPTVAGSFRHIVTSPETLEYLSWRYFGVSEFWWKIADSNALVFPLDIPNGAAVNIPRGSDFGLFLRERSFGG